MWLSNRRKFLAVALVLGACGFTPAYGPGGAARDLLGTVLVDAPDTRAGFTFTREIEQRLGRSDNARYGLGYDLEYVEERMALTPTNVTARLNIVGKVTWALRDLASEEVVSSGTANSFVGYSTTGSTVATLAAQRDAQERLSVILADQVVTQLMAAADTLAGG